MKYIGCRTLRCNPPRHPVCAAGSIDCCPDLCVRRRQGPAFVDRPTELERHWELMKKALTYMEQRGQFSDCVDLIMRAKGSREFGQRSDMSKVRHRRGSRYSQFGSGSSVCLGGFY